MTPQEAVDRPRLHQQWQPDEIFVERFGLSPDTQALLQDMGYRIREQNPWGATELIEVGPQQAGATGVRANLDGAAAGSVRSGFYYGAHDSRRPGGAASGY